MMFSRHLKKLMRDGIIERRVLTFGPPARTEYSLSVLGRDLSAPASAMLQWIERNTDQIQAARASNKRKADDAPAVSDA